MQRVVVFGIANWLGSPRLPRALQRAGFEVAVISGAGTLLGLTRHADRRFEIGDGMLMKDCFGALWDLVVDWGATSVIAVDHRSVSMLHEFAERLHEGELDGRPGKDLFLRMLERSLPPVEQFATLTQKGAAHRLATGLGIPAPAQAGAATLEQALAFAQQHGYPVVLKTEHGAGGYGVQICRDEAQLRESHVLLLQKTAAGDNPLLCERYVHGPQLSHPFVALRGKIYAGLTRLKLESWPGALGPSSVVELVDRPDVAQAAARFAAACDYSGFASMQFLLDAQSGVAQFLEFNCRPVPMMHMDEDLAGIDWCRAWHAAMAGEPPPAFRGPAFGRRIALFPQEWRRDPSSPHLAPDRLVDVPWDDPPLLRGYLRHP